MRSKPDHDKKHATTDKLGNVTAKNQNGIDAKTKPRKGPTSDNWKFGDSLKDVKPDKQT